MLIYRTPLSDRKALFGFLLEHLFLRNTFIGLLSKYKRLVFNYSNQTLKLLIKYKLQIIYNTYRNIKNDKPISFFAKFSCLKTCNMPFSTFNIA